ncbi:MAG: hypothetical protein AVDCRST_MAG87-3907 [uncultured Thermomicrobiales bacterium]|uniref:Uncharacterized protein n=1 Tax=uncultured Thermomicrobiales bacterium TaxID=1645740 RepID=A0A6J4VQB8_9BACT|nr:MAG: hypothetical protein AVDCRST_MAG87-3907 [uncultured Thermomicrobiales bacterium]
MVLDEHLGFLERLEHLSVEELVSEPAVERLASRRRESTHFFGTLGGIIRDLTTRSPRRVAFLPAPTEFHWPTHHIHRDCCAPALLHDADAAGPLDL